MPVEMIGWIAPRVSSELIPPSGPPFDAAVIAETARIHERGSFDRVLIGYFSDAPDGFLVGAHAASVTDRLRLLLAHRPGFVAPPVAARKLATLDQLSNGRLAVHIIAGGSDAEQAKDGDWTDHDARYRRCAEYLSLLRRTWTEPAPFDHDGEFYRTRGTYSEVRCRQQPLSRSMAAAGPTRRSGRWRRMSTSSCCGASRCGTPRSSWIACGGRRRSMAATRPSACRLARSWRQRKAKPGTGPGPSSTGCCSIAAASPRHSARISAPNASCRPPRKPRCTTPACGHRSRSRRALKATRRP
jgi:hypothetical protein